MPSLQKTCPPKGYHPERLIHHPLRSLIHVFYNFDKRK